jgi:4-hydroxy-tetrahydrodipicolinate reductase
MTEYGGPLAVGVLGAGGRMGALVCRAVEETADLRLAARIGRGDSRDPLREASVLVDFTQPDAVMDNIRWGVEHRRHVVVGTSGMHEERLETIGEWLADAPGVGVVVVPNFSIGAVLAMTFAVRAAEYFGTVEIIDYGHASKADAPSGTARRTAELIARARREGGQTGVRQPDPAGRGFDVDGVSIHSVRLDGLVSHQTVILGRDRETLSIRFDTTDRRAFLPGILAAVRAAPRRPGLTVGLEALIDLAKNESTDRENG